MTNVHKTQRVIERDGISNSSVYYYTTSEGGTLQRLFAVLLVMQASMVSYSVVTLGPRLLVLSDPEAFHFYYSATPSRDQQSHEQPLTGKS